MADESNRARPTEDAAPNEAASVNPAPSGPEPRPSAAARPSDQPQAPDEPRPPHESRPGDGAPGEGASADGSGAAGARDDLEARLAQAQAQAAEYQEAFLRTRAEMENMRRRTHDEVSKAHKYAVEAFAESLLPVIDSLEAALKVEHASVEAMRSGVELTLKQLMAAFEKNRLAAVDPAGERFDPNLHQAISMVPSETVPAQHVAATLQKGFTIADRVLRPALVTVSQGQQPGA